MANATKDMEKTAAKGTEAAQSENGSAPDRVKIAQGMRPVYSEIARLSATLSIARTACYEGDPGKAAKALSLLGRQLPLAQEMADLLAPKE